VIMPGLDGRMLAERLRERIPGLAVVLMSGYAEQLRELPRTPEARQMLLLRKPFSRRELLEALRKALAG
jgi:two-component system cell cycle sensor histidine kinase/response regulator CckA